MDEITEIVNSFKEEEEDEEEELVEIKREIKEEIVDDYGDCALPDEPNTEISGHFPVPVDIKCELSNELSKIIELSEENERNNLRNGENDEEEYFECDICLMMFPSEFSMNTHYNVLHKVRDNFKCDLCGIESESSRDYINHRNSHAPKRLNAGETLKQWLVAYDKENECNICFMKFDEVTALAAHKLTHLPQGGYKCRWCNKRTKTKHNHQVHLKSHSKRSTKHQCKICGENFMYKTHLKRHAIFHSSKRYYQCDTCLLLFKTKAEIEKHVAIHMK